MRPYRHKSTLENGRFKPKSSPDSDTSLNLNEKDKVIFINRNKCLQNDKLVKYKSILLGNTSQRVRIVCIKNETF